MGHPLQTRHHFSRYNGYWKTTIDSSIVCEIIDGVLIWTDKFPHPACKLSMGPHGTVEMELHGTAWRGVLEDGDADRLVWSDGDVWQRVENKDAHDISLQNENQTMPAMP